MTFLQMLRKRFEGGDNNVPWELDNKVLAYKYVAKYGYKTPLSESFSSSELASEWAQKNLKSTFVVKAGDKHSSMGVYLLERSKNNYYIELLSLKKMKLDDIGKNIPGKKPSYWIAESYVESYVFGKSIPLDYKFYTFRGKIGLIIQIDRNTSPPKVAIFDGNFIPLIHTKDYWLDPNRWLPSGHALPFNLPKMVEMVSTLSKSLDTDFVSIDCFDTYDGPVFGEFTFAPGAPDVKMVVFSDNILHQLDNMINSKNTASFSGISTDHEEFLKMCTISSEKSITNDVEIYGRIAARMLGNDKKICSIISENDLTVDSRKLKQHIDFILKYISFLNGDTEQSFSLANRIYNGQAFFKIKEEHKPLINAAFDFYNTRKDKGAWFETRLEQIKISYYPHIAEESLFRISELASSGYAYAQNVYKNLTANKN